MKGHIQWNTSGQKHWLLWYHSDLRIMRSSFAWHEWQMVDGCVELLLVHTVNYLVCIVHQHSAKTTVNGDIMENVARSPWHRIMAVTDTKQSFIRIWLIFSGIADHFCCVSGLSLAFKYHSLLSPTVKTSEIVTNCRWNLYPERKHERIIVDPFTLLRIHSKYTFCLCNWFCVQWPSTKQIAAMLRASELFPILQLTGSSGKLVWSGRFFVVDLLV